MSVKTSTTYSDVFYINKVSPLRVSTKKQKRIGMKKGSNSRKSSRDEIISSCVISVFCDNFDEDPEFLQNFFKISNKSFVFRQKQIDLELVRKLFWEENEELECYLMDVKKEIKKIVEALNISQILSEIKNRMLNFLISDSKLSCILNNNSNFEHINNFQFNCKFGAHQASPIVNSKNKSFDKISIEISPHDYKILSELSKECNYAEPVLNSEMAVKFLMRKMTGSGINFEF